MTLLKLPRILNTKTISNKHKVQLVKDQFDFFWSSRVRKSISSYLYYRKLWDENHFRLFLKCFRNNIVSKSSKFYVILSHVNVFK